MLRLWSEVASTIKSAAQAVSQGISAVRRDLMVRGSSRIPFQDGYACRTLSTIASRTFVEDTAVVSRSSSIDTLEDERRAGATEGATLRQARRKLLALVNGRRVAILSRGSSGRSP
jgi:hypothetical protein